MLAFILYFYPNYHFTPNHRTCLGSPPTSQTKPRIPCYSLSSKNQHKRFSLTPLPSAPLSPFSPPLSLLFSLPIILPQSRHPRSKITTASTKKLASKNQTPKSPFPKKSVESPSYLPSQSYFPALFSSSNLSRTLTPHTPPLPPLLAPPQAPQKTPPST